MTPKERSIIVGCRRRGYCGLMRRIWRHVVSAALLVRTLSDGYVSMLTVSCM